MRFQNIFFIAIIAFLLSACSGSNTPTNSTNAATNKTANVAATNSNNPLATNRTPEAATANNAPTLAPVVQSYYDFWKKKDDAGLKKIFSQATLKSFETDMKTDKKSSLSDWLSSNETLPDKPFEARNEKIENDAAVAEIKGGSYAVWTPVKFVKENGEWKMTNESPDFDSVRK